MSETGTEAPTASNVIAQFLATAPLYKIITVTGKGPRGEGPFTQEQLDTRRVYFPWNISLFCDHPKCRREMDWEVYSGAHRTYHEPAGVPVQPSPKVQDHTYGCRHCGQRRVTFFLRFTSVSHIVWSLEKVGQAPRQQPNLSHELLEGLGTHRQDLYRKAVEARNQDMGLGSLAYLRRVVEDAMSALLDLLQSAVAGADKEAEMLTAIERAKAEKVFTNKVGFAKAALPPRFFHGGHNPLERLHDWASAGIHNRDDWECIEIFDEIRSLFEILFERLAREAADKKLYEQKLTDLTRKK